MWRRPLATVSQTGAAAGSQLLLEAGGSEGAGGHGGVGEAILQLVDQVVSGGDLRHKSKGFIPGGSEATVPDLPSSSSSSPARHAGAGTRTGRGGPGSWPRSAEPG